MNIDESLTAKGFTPAALAPAVFRRGRSIKSITIHHWGAFGQTHDGVNNFFVNGPGTTSAHYNASAGRVNCLVSPLDAAWHSGNAEGNATSIGIECRPEATDGDYQTVAELVRYLRARFGPLPLVPHRDWQATACPGIWDLQRLDALASGTITLQSTTIQEDEMALTPTFDEDVRGSLKNITNEVTGLHDLNIDVRGDLANKGRQLAALTAATDQLATLLAEKQGLTVEDIRAALAGAIADGIKVTVGNG